MVEQATKSCGVVEWGTTPQLEATVDDLMATVHAHPTLWEAMADAANAVNGLTINI